MDEPQSADQQHAFCLEQRDRDETKVRMQGSDDDADGERLKHKARQYGYRPQIVSDPDACQKHGRCDDLEQRGIEWVEH